MLLYVLICVSLSLVGVAGLQFAYLFWLERIDNYRKQHTRNLERRCIRLTRELAAAKQRIHEQDLLFVAGEDEFDEGDEAWADVIDDR